MILPEALKTHMKMWVSELNLGGFHRIIKGFGIKTDTGNT
jgi:hypothetical protein